MSDEVRPNSSPAPPDAGGSRLDPVDGPKSLEIEFPTPDIDIVDSGPLDETPAATPPSQGADPKSGPKDSAQDASPDGVPSGVTVLPNREVASLRSTPQNDAAPRDPPSREPASRDGAREPASRESASREPLARDANARDAVPRASDRPPPPSQRMASHPAGPPRPDVATPVPPSPAGPPRPDAATPVPPSPHPLPLAPMTNTLPAPAPVLDSPLAARHFPPAAPLPFEPEDEPAPSSIPAPLPGMAPTTIAKGTGLGGYRAAAPYPPGVGALANESSGIATEPAPAQRMLSEPVPLVTKVAPSSPPTKQPTLRPGLVEPKRIIQVLGSNVPVLDTALEEEAIEDLDESEAHELAETPVTDPPISLPDAELEVNVVVEDDGPLDAPKAPSADESDDGDAEAVALDSEPAPSSDYGANGSFDAVPPESAEAAAKRAKVPPNKRRPPPPSSRSSELRKVDPSPPGARKWWEEMFSEEFLRAIPILSPKQLEREVNFIDEALSADRGARILDLACGAGQHAVELATRGYDLVGFDLSQSQLDWAGGLARERNQKLQFTYGDMRDLSYNESFDAVYCWNTSFGFFEEEKNVDVAQRIFRALRPGGRFLLDVINRDFVVAQQPGQTWFEGDGCVCIDDVSIDFITSRMKVKRTLMLTNGKNRECNYSVRIYGLHELGKMLHDVGFKVLNVSGRPEMPGVFFGATSPRIIILAVKP